MNKIIPIRKNKDFLAAYKKGKALVTPYYIVYVRKNRLKVTRFGITAGKKCGNSVKRARCRRLARVIYTENADIFPKSCDVVLVARLGMSEHKSNELSAGFRKAAVPFLRKNFGR